MHIKLTIRTIFLAFITFILSECFAKAQLPEFDKEYFIDSVWNWPFEIIQSGSHYMVCGGATGVPNTDYYAFLLNVDSAGNEIWNQQYPNTSMGFGMENTFSSFYLQDGWSNVLKTDETGNITDSFANVLPVTYDLTVIPTGSFFQTGSASDNFGYSRFGFTKFFNGGTLAFSKWIDSSYGYGTSLQHSSDKLVFGCGAGLPDPFFIDSSYTIAFLSDTNGTLLWKNVYDTLNNYVASEMIRATDAGFILYGTSPAPGNEIFLIKTDLNGNTEWKKSYPGFFWTTPHCIATDSFSVAFLATNGKSFPEDSILIIKTNLLGDTIATRSFSGTGGSLLETSDHGYVIGIMKRYEYDDDIYSNLELIKIDSVENWDHVVNLTANSTSALKVYPNPCHDELVMRCNNSESKEAFIHIYNKFGACVYSGQLNNLKRINSSLLMPGIYSIVLSNSDTIFQALKFVKQ
jgi:hypothetical protein